MTEKNPPIATMTETETPKGKTKQNKTKQNKKTKHKS
jgi:hypothetical protein